MDAFQHRYYEVAPLITRLWLSEGFAVPHLTLSLFLIILLLTQTCNENVFLSFPYKFVRFLSAMNYKRKSPTFNLQGNQSRGFIYTYE